jgi:hypothetical protein
MSKDPDHFTQLILLLRLVICLNQGNARIQSFVSPIGAESHPLAGISAILVMDEEVIAARHTSGSKVVVSNESYGSGTNLDASLANTCIKVTMPAQGRSLWRPNVQRSNKGSGECNLNPHELRLADLTTATFGPRYSSICGILHREYYPAHLSNSDPLAIRGMVPISLESHAKTVAAYLNCYKRASSVDQEKYGRDFYAYLLTACWKKMHARISSWPAVGLIFGLHAALTLNVLKDVIEQFDWDKLPAQRRRGDRTLAHVLISNAASLGYAMDKLEPNYRSISKLLQAATSSVKSDTDYRIYSKETAYEFHCFVLAIFFGFSRSLKHVNDIRR